MNKTLKELNIFLILFITNLSGSSQNTITTKTPCTEEMAFNEKGSWINFPIKKLQALTDK